MRDIAQRTLYETAVREPGETRRSRR